MRLVERQTATELPARVAVIGGLRTPFARRAGALRSLPATELLGLVIAELVARHDVTPRDVGLAVLGLGPSSTRGAERDVARVVARAGLPEAVHAYAVTRGCLTTLDATAIAANAVAHGEARAAVSGGAQSASQRPIALPARLSGLLREAANAGSWFAAARVLLRASQGDVREPELPSHERVNVDLTRADLDAFVARAHERADADPHASGDRMRLFAPPSFARAVARDDAPDATLEADGACALLLASEEAARDEGLEVTAWLRAWCWTPPELTRGAAPLRAIGRVLERVGAGLDDVAAIELHAPTADEIVLASRLLDSRALARRTLGGDAPTGALGPERLNVNGGSLAIGHPRAATGARAVLDAGRTLASGRGRYALAVVSGHDGAGGAMLLEAPN